jgi:hypothetical protein
MGGSVPRGSQLPEAVTLGRAALTIYEDGVRNVIRAEVNLSTIAEADRAALRDDGQ